MIGREGPTLWTLNRDIPIAEEDVANDSMLVISERPTEYVISFRMEGRDIDIIIDIDIDSHILCFRLGGGSFFLFSPFFFLSFFLSFFLASYLPFFPSFQISCRV